MVAPPFGFLGYVMAEEKPKVKIGKWCDKLLKWSAFAPSLLLLPEFVVDPMDWRIAFLAIVIVYWFLIFMVPHSAIRYLIKRYGVGQMMVNVLSFWSVVGMWGISGWLWFGVFTSGNGAEWTLDEFFPTGIFVIPFVALVWVGLGILCLTLLYKTYYYVKERAVK